MNIQAKKLSLIEWMVSLQDETVINTMYHFREKLAHNPTKRINISELIAELELSEKARKTGKVVTIEELEKGIKKLVEGFMKIIFTDIARARLKDIYIYHKHEASVKVAQSIKDTIINEIHKLKKYPELGNEEEYLSKLKRGYRKLIIGNYKAIYRIIDNTIVIDTIFDSRQEPKEMVKGIKKKK